jgi:transcriptional regulator with XRE-family HTH domain
MPTRERRLDRGIRISQRVLALIGNELRDARLSAGLSQAAVAAASGLSTTQISRIERARLPSASLDQVARLASILGLDLSVKFYPAGQPLRDQAHLELIARFRARLGPGLVVRTEVPVPIAGDPRAWDAVVDGGPKPIGTEAETRLRDWQALERRIALKARDSGIDRVILLVSATRANRAALRAAQASVHEMFPIPARVALRALAEGRDPGGSAIIML